MLNQHRHALLYVNNEEEEKEQIQASNKLKFAAQIFTYFTTLLKILKPKKKKKKTTQTKSIYTMTHN